VQEERDFLTKIVEWQAMRKQNKHYSRYTQPNEGSRKREM